MDDRTKERIAEIVSEWGPLSDALKDELAKVLNPGSDDYRLRIKDNLPPGTGERDLHQQADDSALASDP
jgi:hypothetical protein